MEYPYGHPNHRPHHHRRDGEEEEYPPPAFDPHRPSPPFYEQPPPPPHVANVYHSSHAGVGEPHHTPPMSDYYDPPPPPPSQGFNYPDSHGYQPSPPSQGFNYPDSHGYQPPPVVQHVSHESENNPHHHRPHVPSFVSEHIHHQGPEVTNHKPTVRVFSKAESNFSLSIRDGKVILARSNPSDPLQHWVKDEKFSTRVKDSVGFPSFALINKATGQAMKHSIGATHPVQLIPYNPDVLDESILWTESEDLGDGFRTIRMVNNIRLNVDAFNGEKKHGGVHDGTTIYLWEWKKGENQRWKIVPYCFGLNASLME